MLLHCARDPSFARISLHQHNVETETELGMVRVSSVVTAWALLPGSCQWYCETNYVSDHRNQRVETSGRSEKWASQCRQSAAALLVRSSGGLLLFPDNFARPVIIFICRHTTQHIMKPGNHRFKAECGNETINVKFRTQPTALHSGDIYDELMHISNQNALIS